MSTKISGQDRQATSAPGGVGAVDRALALLDAFTLQEPALSLTELAERTGQYKSTASRMLTSLEHAGTVHRRIDGRFSLGPAIVRLHAIYSRTFLLGDAVMPALQSLVAATRESATFHVRQRDDDLCLHRVDSPHAVRDSIREGDRTPLRKSAAGFVLAAFSGARGPRHARIRREHVFIANGDLVPELAAIAAPVFDATGALVGAVALTMPSTRLQTRHTAAVTQAALEITTRVGGILSTDASRAFVKGVAAPGGTLVDR